MVRLTPHGVDALARSARVFDEARAVTPDDVFALDVPGWFGSA